MISGAIERLRCKAEASVRRHPFLRLVQHFCARATGSSSTSDVDFGLGALLALLAVPGAFTSILLLNKYSSLLQFMRGQPHFNPYLACLSDEYFFIVYSMTISGLITLLRWDQLLPDARDFINLGTLPLSLRKIFAANVIALATLAGLFAIDINLISALVFPVLVTLQNGAFSSLIEVAAAHVLATLGISAFTFLSLIALQGVLMATLPHGLYRRIAAILRSMLLIFLSGTLISVFILPLPFLRVNYGSLKAASWWPPLWFLGLFESRVTELKAVSPMSGTVAWKALGMASLLAICGFSLSYKRYFLKITESQSGPAKVSGPRWLGFDTSLFLLRLILHPGFETACFKFIFRTLLRSETQLIFASLWAGIGLLLALEGLTQQTILIAPFTFKLFSLGGIRFVFDIPSATAANWTFRLSASEGSKMVRAACRKLLLIAGLVPLICIWFPIAVHETSWRLGTLYLCFHVLSIAALIELLLWKFQKLPFTCSFASNRDGFLKMLIGLMLVLMLILPALARVEAFIASRTAAIAIWIAAVLSGLWWLYRSSAPDSEAVLYQNPPDEAFTLLRLGAG